jgi:hypothetical protein
MTSSLVREVMTAEVVTAEASTPFRSWTREAPPLGVSGG